MLKNQKLEEKRVAEQNVKTLETQIKQKHEAERKAT
jgi:hypothetical protein